MLKHGLLAAGLVLASAAPALAQVQVSPGPPMPPPPGTHEIERTTTTVTTVAPVAPPPLEAETPPPPSAPDLTWKPGHWAWNLDARQYEWVKGSYVERPSHMVKFTPGYWERRPEGWYWTDGRWR
ncbi:MAG TPA: hypothetical protein VHW66_18090 [Stellaceae bacterium]|jgi:hypothetical protein|nr:hypothetical protein [Stellaceae bacterium]